MRRERGQGTVEYLAVVLLVALVFGATATAATAKGREIAGSVPREIIRALCIVRGGDCYRDRAPCDVASTTKSKSWAVTVTVFKIGHDRTVTVTRRSDGRYAVTLDTAPVGGVETGVGARGKLSLGKHSYSAGADLTAGVTASYAHGRTWIVPTDQAADRLRAAMKSGSALPPADIDGREVEVEGRLGGSAGAGVNVSVGALASLGGGSQTDRATGNRTYFFTAGVGGEAGVSAERAKAGAAVAGSDRGRYALTVGPDGRWIDLAVTQTGALSGRADLPPQVSPIAFALDVPTKAGRQWVTESHLDLTEAENLAAARALVVRASDPLHPGRLTSALAGLSERLRHDAIVDARTYALDATAYGAEGHAGAELKLGGKFEMSTEKTRLVAATTRGIDGQWRVRDDCLQEART